MRSFEHVSCLVDLDICNSSVPPAWTNIVMISELASIWQLLVSITRAVG